MKKVMLSILGLCFFLSPVYQKIVLASTTLPRAVFEKSFHHPTDSKIQIALLLDTSNSMDGLIEQAKSQLWKMVNELAAANRDGSQPDIELALYHYGNSDLSGESLFIEKLTDLSKDLDLVSEKLFSLRTNGGNEYCGAVIKRAITDLEWSKSPNDLRLIIIAGNEPFTQGPVDYKSFCQKAKSLGIQINTIFCGDYQEGKSTGWWQGAHLAEGKYMNIDQDQRVIHISTPYDQRILELNLKLNATYIGYGAIGESKMQNQVQQDVNASSYGAANARTRASVKAKKSYSNATWDLVDAAEEDADIVISLDDSSLPPAMQNMNKEERIDYVDQKKKERKEIQKEILDLEKQAKAFESKERAKISDTGKTLDNQLIEAVKEQALQKKFSF